MRDFMVVHYEKSRKISKYFTIRYLDEGDWYRVVADKDTLRIHNRKVIANTPSKTEAEKIYSSILKTSDIKKEYKTSPP